MNKVLTAALATTLLTGVAGAVQAQQEGNWMVRARAINIMPDHKSDAAPGIPADSITVNN
jgi:outer membrane protein